MDRVIELVWDEDSEMSDVVEAMENVFWSVEAVMAMGASSYWEPLHQDVTERLLATPEADVVMAEINYVWSFVFPFGEIF